MIQESKRIECSWQTDRLEEHITFHSGGALRGITGTFRFSREDAKARSRKEKGYKDLVHGLRHMSMTCVCKLLGQRENDGGGCVRAGAGGE